MKRVIIVGSPRSNGRSAHLAEMLFEANIDERPQDELFLVPISEIEVGPCIGCGACKKQSTVIFKDDDGNEVSELRYRCIFDDDMQTLYDLLDEADALTIVTPVYFSGAPAPMKCVLDRLQPYFWPYLANGPRLPKRPLELHVIGEGGDPHGFDPLIGEVKSATLLAGFEIERIYNWVGKISAEGEILEDATVLEPPEKPMGTLAETAEEHAPKPGLNDELEVDFDPQATSTTQSEHASIALMADVIPVQRPIQHIQGRPRPKLDFSKSAKAPADGAEDRQSSKAGGSTERTKTLGKGESRGKGKGNGKTTGKSSSRGAGFRHGDAKDGAKESARGGRRDNMGGAKSSARGDKQGSSKGNTGGAKGSARNGKQGNAGGMRRSAGGSSAGSSKGFSRGKGKGKGGSRG